MRYAWSAIRRRPVRSALTAIGIGLAVALVVLLLSIGAGIQTSAVRLAAQSGVDVIASSAPVTSSQFPPIPRAHSLPAAFERASPLIANSSPWLLSDLVFGNATLWAAANQSQHGGTIPPGWTLTAATSIGWIPGDNAGLDVPTITEGPGFSSSGDPHFADNYTGPFTHEVVIDSELAVELGVGVNSTLWTSNQPIPPNATGLAGWYANATGFRVVGISQPYWLIPSASLAFFYLSELQTVIGVASPQLDYASLVLIHTVAPSDAAAAAAALSRAFPQLYFIPINEILTTIESTVSLYESFGALVGAIGVIVALLFTGAVLWMSVDDRSREIAVLRAVGFPRSVIGGYVLEEGLTLSALGLVIGLPLAYLGSIGLNAFLSRLVTGLPLGFSFVSFNDSVIASALGLVVAIGLAAAAFPAARAVRLPIAEELRAP